MLTFPVFVGIVSAGLLSRYGLIVEFSGGAVGGAISNYYVDKKKEELKRSEQETLSNSSNNSNAKNGEV